MGMGRGGVARGPNQTSEVLHPTKRQRSQSPLQRSQSPLQKPGARGPGDTLTFTFRSHFGYLSVTYLTESCLAFNLCLAMGNSLWNENDGECCRPLEDVRGILVVFLQGQDHPFGDCLPLHTVVGAVAWADGEEGPTDQRQLNKYEEKR